MKDQLTDYLPALLQIKGGLDVCGLMNTIKSHPDVWRPVFECGTILFKITADEFLDSLDVQYSTSQMRKQEEVDTFKFFSDVIEKLDTGLYCKSYRQQNSSYLELCETPSRRVEVRSSHWGRPLPISAPL